MSQQDAKFIETIFLYIAFFALLSVVLSIIYFVILKKRRRWKNLVLNPFSIFFYMASIVMGSMYLAVVIQSQYNEDPEDDYFYVDLLGINSDSSYIIDFLDAIYENLPENKRVYYTDGGYISTRIFSTYPNNRVSEVKYARYFYYIDMDDINYYCYFDSYSNGRAKFGYRRDGSVYPESRIIEFQELRRSIVRWLENQNFENHLDKLIHKHESTIHIAWEIRRPLGIETIVGKTLNELGEVVDFEMTVDEGFIMALLITDYEVIDEKYVFESNLFYMVMD